LGREGFGEAWDEKQSFDVGANGFSSLDGKKEKGWKKGFDAIALTRKGKRLFLDYLGQTGGLD